MQPETPVYPVRVRGDLDPALSRWQWIFKWILAIPHYIVLFFLYIAYFVVTVIAFFAILFTARYPRGLFDFNVGVMRWGWRVRFYALSPLGTDRYPPFSLRPDENYPADLDVDYPERLHRWLVLIKWWLLAIPQYLIVAIIAGGGMRYWGGGHHGHHGHDMYMGGGMSWISLLSVLVIIAAIALLFTGKYPRGLFDFVMGLLRWTIRVRAYTSLMRDEYPPFRLDQGAREPGAAAAPVPGREPEPGPAPESGPEPESGPGPEPGPESS
ncbi:DUF4389 domain-containing protein [Nocardia miyunensis]|uniref:DUF4389 domain-containing protein n=1 Tax=Nocardia miyunensis TaxID=282684 RepID=UPI0009FC7416|nr:DUF4389 domain-containing protein [Nocardia miyunensis]